MGSLIFKGHTEGLMQVLYHWRPGGDRVDCSVCTDVFTHTPLTYENYTNSGRPSKSNVKIVLYMKHASILQPEEHWTL